MHEHCTTWKLKVNVDKSNIFCQGRLRNNLKFNYDGKEIENEFTYFGVLLLDLVALLKQKLQCR